MSETDDKKDPKPTETEDKGGDDKDWKAEAEKWKAQARKQEQRAKENADAAQKLKDREDADKSESEKAAAKAADAEKRAAEAELRAMRIEIAAEKGLKPGQAKFVVGTTREELEANAEELRESFKSDDDKGKPGSKPNESLKGGGDPTEEPEEMDPRKLAEQVPRY